MDERKHIFIPVTDDLLDAHPELIVDLVPYSIENRCLHWLDVVVDPPQDDPLTSWAPIRVA